jgi:hypothetical protein
MFDALYRLLTGLDHPHRAAEKNDSAFALARFIHENVARRCDGGCLGTSFGGIGDAG